LNRYLEPFDSQDRLGGLIESTLGEPDEVFWPVWLDWWNVCDFLWPYRGIVLDMLRFRDGGTKAYPFQSPKDRALYDELPPTIEVFRGGKRPTIRGVSWTTDRRVAEGFATGKRARTPDPRLAVAQIDKAHVFFLSTERQEAEVVLNWRRLRRLTINELDPIDELRQP
jgi:hypothetical protein